ncbi:MAG: hypothetical protein E7K72_19315 [Roseomonas mucosa]|nr:hypothetical protein [Roseomonas mucosa]
MADSVDSCAPERRIPFGDTTIELTEMEVRLGAVSFLYKSHPDARAQLRYASPEVILLARFPHDMFQVSADGYESMKARAERLLAIRRQREYKAGPKGPLP